MEMTTSLEEGKAEARVRERADAVLTVLRMRGLAVHESVRARILAEKDIKQLKRWHERAVFAPSVSIVFDDLKCVPTRRIGEGETPDVWDFFLDMLTSWEEGKAETRAEAVLTVLEMRGGDIADVVRDRILAETDMTQQQRWLEKAILAPSVSDVIDEIDEME